MSSPSAGERTRCRHRSVSPRPPRIETGLEFRDLQITFAALDLKQKAQCLTNVASRANAQIGHNRSAVETWAFRPTSILLSQYLNTGL